MSGASGASLVETYTRLLRKMEARQLTAYTDSCHARLVEKCIKYKLPLPGALSWSDSYFIDRLFFKTGGAYKLDEWGRPPTGEEITISPIRVHDIESVALDDEVMVLGCITGTVTNRGMLTFDLQKTHTEEE